jgi:hypothetical protein
MGAEAIKAITSIKPMTNNNTQKAHFCPAMRPLRMTTHTSTETITEQELYRIVNALSDSTTLASRPAISDRYDAGQYHGGEQEIDAAPHGQESRTSL